MDQIKGNVNVLRDALQRSDFDNKSAIDVFTAFYVLLGKTIDYSIEDDKYFRFLLACISGLQDVHQRHHWMGNMFSIYEKLSAVSPTDPNWLMLQANLIFLSPINCRN